MVNVDKFRLVRAFAVRLFLSAKGAVKIEYALLVFLIGIGLIGTLEAIGLSISDILTNANESIEEGTPE